MAGEMHHPIETAGPRREKVAMSASDRARYAAYKNGPVPYRAGFGNRNDPWSATTGNATDPWYTDFAPRGIWPPDPAPERK